MKWCCRLLIRRIGALRVICVCWWNVGAKAKKVYNATQSLKQYCRLKYSENPGLSPPPRNSCCKADFVRWAEDNGVSLENFNKTKVRKKRRLLSVPVSQHDRNPSQMRGVEIHHPRIPPNLHSNGYMNNSMKLHFPPQATFPSRNIEPHRIATSPSSKVEKQEPLIKQEEENETRTPIKRCAIENLIN